MHFLSCCDQFITGNLLSFPLYVFFPHLLYIYTPSDYDHYVFFPVYLICFLHTKVNFCVLPLGCLEFYQKRDCDFLFDFLDVFAWE
uniref:Putative ovule protein n=1 Tax=Solanum chacoense TaxID=4108 RepID=A0A0V0ITH3_SOLCH